MYVLNQAQIRVRDMLHFLYTYMQGMICPGMVNDTWYGQRQTNCCTLGETAPGPLQRCGMAVPVADPLQSTWFVHEHDAPFDIPLLLHSSSSSSTS